MKIGRLRNLALAVISLTAIAGGSSSASLAANSLKLSTERVYFVMLDRFANGDPSNDAGGYSGGADSSGFDPTDNGYFHGGDIEGLRSKLPYIKSLGFTAIWVTPVTSQQPVSPDGRSAAYHGYWGSGFDQVDSHWGTMESFEDLVTTAHTQGLKVILDIVANHTADVIHYTDGSGYLGSDAVPYKDYKGKVFDAAKIAGTSKFPILSLTKTFPHTLYISPGLKNIKSPSWLNDPRNYHNRGDSSFTGESSQWGDFFGLDDLFTENPTVVRGMSQLWANWITQTGVDGFRIDTARHVNPAFWQVFIPTIQKAALKQGKTSFPIWGEVYDADPTQTSWWVVNGGLPSILDFPLQKGIYNFITQGSASVLTDLLNADDYYTTAKTSPLTLGTFLGNHDMGRIGGALNSRGKPSSEVLKQDELAHALLFTLRGSPIVYYGDEVGMTGGNDKNARQDMFPTQVSSWQSEPRVGSLPIGGGSSFDSVNSLKKVITSLNELRSANPAFATGSQWIRLARNGGFVFSRFDPSTHIEYLASFNSLNMDSVFDVPAVSTPTATWKLISGQGYAVANGTGATISLPSFGWAVFVADHSPTNSGKPSISMGRVSLDSTTLDRLEVSAKVKSIDPLSVSFFALPAGAKKWVSLGIDFDRSFATGDVGGNLYRVFPLESQFKAGSTVSFRAIATNSSGVMVTSNIQKFKVPR